MKITAEIQVASTVRELPSETDIEDWIRATLGASGRNGAALTVRIVDEAEITALNHRYRQHDAPTDVLAFAHQLPDAIAGDLIGDVIVCAGVINRHADHFQIDRRAHWARIISHGILHLLGYDHDRLPATRKMEKMEGAILHRLGLHHPELHHPAS